MSAHHPRFPWERAILKSGIHPTTRHVLLTLGTYVGNYSAYPGIPTLVTDTGLSERAVRKHLDLAVAAGWLDRKERVGSGKGWRLKIYEIRYPDGMERGSSPSPANGVERRSTPSRPQATLGVDLRSDGITLGAHGVAPHTNGVEPDDNIVFRESELSHSSETKPLGQQVFEHLLNKGVNTDPRRDGAEHVLPSVTAQPPSLKKRGQVKSNGETQLQDPKSVRQGKPADPPPPTIWQRHNVISRFLELLNATPKHPDESKADHTQRVRALVEAEINARAVVTPEKPPESPPAKPRGLGANPSAMDLWAADEGYVRMPGEGRKKFRERIGPLYALAIANGNPTINQPTKEI